MSFPRIQAHAQFDQQGCGNPFLVLEEFEENFSMLLEE